MGWYSCGDFAVPAVSSAVSDGGPESERRVVLGFFTGACRYSNNASEVCLSLLVLRLSLCERVRTLGAPGGALLVSAVGLASSGGLDVRSPATMSTAADFLFPFFLLVAAADSRLASTMCAGSGTRHWLLRLFNALTPLMEEEGGLRLVPADSAGGRDFVGDGSPVGDLCDVILGCSRVCSVKLQGCTVCYV